MIKLPFLSRRRSTLYCSGHLIRLISFILFASNARRAVNRRPRVIISNRWLSVTFDSVLFSQCSRKPVWVAITQGLVWLPVPYAGISPLEYTKGIETGDWPISEYHTLRLFRPGKFCFSRNPET